MAYKDPEKKKEASRLYHERKKNDPEYIERRKENARKFHEGYKNPNLTSERSREYSRKSRQKNIEKRREEDREYKRKISQTEEYKTKAKTYREKNKEKIKEYKEKYKEDGRSQWFRIKSRYGITKDDFLNQLKKQNQLCSICLQPFENSIPCIDHCHKTGKFRGLLHRHCNSLLGFAQDNPSTLLNAINYLNEHSSSQETTCIESS